MQLTTSPCPRKVPPHPQALRLGGCPSFSRKTSLLPPHQAPFSPAQNPHGQGLPLAGGWAPGSALETQLAGWGQESRSRPTPVPSSDFPIHTVGVPGCTGTGRWWAQASGKALCPSRWAHPCPSRGDLPGTRQGAAPQGPCAKMEGRQDQPTRPALTLVVQKEGVPSGFKRPRGLGPGVLSRREKPGGPAGPDREGWERQRRAGGRARVLRPQVRRPGQPGSRSPRPTAVHLGGRAGSPQPSEHPKSHSTLYFSHA